MIIRNILGVVAQTSQPQYLVTSSTGQTFMTSTYPQGIATQPQMMQSMPYTGQAAFTNVAYSSQYEQANAPPMHVH